MSLKIQNIPHITKETHYVIESIGEGFYDKRVGRFTTLPYARMFDKLRDAKKCVRQYSDLDDKDLKIWTVETTIREFNNKSERSYGSKIESTTTLKDFIDYSKQKCLKDIIKEDYNGVVVQHIDTEEGLDYFLKKFKFK